MTTNSRLKRGTTRSFIWSFVNIWRRLTEPEVSIREPECNRRARLVSSILLFLIPLPIIGTLSGISFYPLKAPLTLYFLIGCTTITNHLFRSYGVNPDVIATRINVDDVLLDIDMAIPCGLIINELVSNSLKHAFLDGREGEIRIDLRSGNNGQLALMVGDNGVGFPKDFDFRNTPSLGLKLVNILVEQLEGSIEYEKGDETTFVITLSQ